MRELSVCSRYVHSTWLRDDLGFGRKVDRIEIDSGTGMRNVTVTNTANARITRVHNLHSCTQTKVRGACPLDGWQVHSINPIPGASVANFSDLSLDTIGSKTPLVISDK